MSETWRRAGQKPEVDCAVVSAHLLWVKLVGKVYQRSQRLFSQLVDRARKIVTDIQRAPKHGKRCKPLPDEVTRELLCRSGVGSDLCQARWQAADVPFRNLSPKARHLAFRVGEVLASQKRPNTHPRSKCYEQNNESA
jgi:hypothetical protein